MTQEEKQLLITDLCARLPYGVILQINKVITEKLYNILCRKNTSDWFVNGYNLDYNEVKPYLRPISSMTEEEYKELKSISPYYGFAPYEYIGDWGPNYEMIDWLIKNHFDYRGLGLIPKGAALEAPEGMYK